ncbi:MAG: hypothetical protein ABIQ74_09815 [Chitinophagales bacterium]
MFDFLHSTNSRKRIIIFGNLYLLIHFIIAIVYFKERIFLDGAYYFFHIAQGEMFHVEHQRFILIVSQLLAVTGINLHLPLNTVLLLNSMNPVIYLWLFFILSIFWLRHEGISLALLLSSVCGIYFIWFCPMYEVWYGSVLLIFFAGLLERKFYNTIIQQVIFGAILVTLLFSYPLIFFGVLIFSASHFLREKKIPGRVIGIFLLSFIGWAVFKYFFISQYETGKIEYPASQVSETILRNFSGIQDIKDFFIFLFSIYPEELIAMIVTVFFLFLQREKLQALLLTGSVLVFILIINITQEHPWKHTNYYERMYLLLIPLTTVPFMQRVYFSVKQKWIIEAAVLVIVAIRMNQITRHADVYAHHVEMIYSLIEKSRSIPGSKFMVSLAAHPELASLDEWSLPMETLIYSSLKSNKHSATLSWKADIENPEIAGKLDDHKFRLRLDEIFPDYWLNQNYFHLQNGPYRELIW